MNRHLVTVRELSRNCVVDVVEYNRGCVIGIATIVSGDVCVGHKLGADLCVHVSNNIRRVPTRNALTMSTRAIVSRMLFIILTTVATKSVSNAFSSPAARVRTMFVNLISPSLERDTRAHLLNVLLLLGTVLYCTGTCKWP